jgi:hypothetical protein
MVAQRQQQQEQQQKISAHAIAFINGMPQTICL